MDGGTSSDSDAPEELTAVEGIQKYEEITEIQTKSAVRVARESKERRRQWGKRNTRAKPSNADALEVTETEEPEKEPTIPEVPPSDDDKPTIPGMLPSNIVELLAAREKKTFSSDSEEEIVNDKPSKKKRQKTSGPQAVLLKEIPPAQCLQNSMEFLKRRKMQVARSSSVLKNSKALRQLS
ncbi:putative PH domain-containing protein [Iris pallida]|uniref:PH domain-containing protein n=1 Tax=Iris pallida TaxID=29817 RepID=A0AAX6EIX3_IRIPA|nr:putative PH domain-containing protein [Iris pallida]